MALMMAKLHDALIAGNVPADKAREAAEEAAGYETRFGAVEARLAVLSWMVGFNIALTVAVLAMLLRAAP